MTEEEVNLIYEYLHEHCDYHDGELIRKISSYGQPIGRKIGMLCISRMDRNGHPKTPSIFATITVNGKKYKKQLSFFIYVFHHKIWPNNLQTIDGNPLNIKIENLCIPDKKDLYKTRILSRSLIRKNTGVVYCKDKKRYRSSTGLGGKRMLIGYFDNQLEAQDAVKYIRSLYFNENIPIDKLKQIAKQKYRSKLKSNTGIRNIYFNGKAFGYAFMRRGVLTRVFRYKTPEEAHAAYLKAKEERSNEVR